MDTRIFLTSLGLILATAANAQSPLPASSVTQIVFLGTGTPVPDAHHQGPSLAIVVNGQPYVVDCGPGVVRQATAGLGKYVKKPIVAHLTRAFITHLHTDHTMGYPDLMFSPAITGRREPLEVYGPVGLKRMTKLLENAWSEDREVRFSGGENANQVAYRINTHEIEPGLIYEDKNVKVKAFLVMHGKWEHAYGFRFETPDRVIVVSGDTTYCPNLIENAKGCDVLIHEVYSEAGLKQFGSNGAAYHGSYHTSGHDVGLIAALVKPKLLLLWHELPFGQPAGEIVTEVNKLFHGPVIEANDLDSF